MKKKNYDCLSEMCENPSLYFFCSLFINYEFRPVVRIVRPFFS